MTNPFEYPWTGDRKQWKVQTCDVPDRRVDTSEVLSSSPIDWPEGLANKILSIPGDVPVPWDGRVMLSGRPLQRVGGKTILFTERNTYRGTSRDLRVPRPLANHLWVEGMPSKGGAHDRHWIGVADDGSTWELIGVRFGLVFRGGHWWRPAIGWGCLAAARYSPEGVLKEGDAPVIKSGHQVSSLLLNRWDPPHRLNITLTDYAAGGDSDGTADWEFPAVGDWVCLDASRVPAGLDLEQQRVADMLVKYGAIIGDRGGHNQLSVVPGAQWAGAKVSNLHFRLSDFRRVTT